MRCQKSQTSLLNSTAVLLTLINVVFAVAVTIAPDAATLTLVVAHPHVELTIIAHSRSCGCNIHTCRVAVVNRIVYYAGRLWFHGPLNNPEVATICILDEIVKTKRLDETAKRES